MNIGIIGYGVVGKAVEYTLCKNYKIYKYDKFFNLDKIEKVVKSEIIFITVPTPFDYSNHKVDDSAIQESLDFLHKEKYNGIVIIKSTIPPGFCDSYKKRYNLSLVFNPEFLRESTTPNEDFENQNTVVIGTPSSSNFELVKSMFEKVLVSDANYYHVSFKGAEMIKCAQNTMLASRVALANVIFDACEDHGLDYSLIKEVAFDRFKILGPHMVQVPGPDGKRGFGGKCLPKDINAFHTIHNSQIIKELIDYNKTLRTDI